ncbi:Helicase associated domain protein [bacterium]|nr:Helicase associated domain protein [bacterium]
MHKATRKFLRAGIFKNLKSFDQLEKRIAKIKLNKDRGDAFEVFVVGYLRVIVKSYQILTSSEITPSLRRKLNFPPKVEDAGVDGIYENETGEWVAYQVKFREDRGSLSLGELSTFFSATEDAPFRCIITNAKDITDRVKNKKRLFSIRNHDFSKLGKRDLSEIEKSLAGKVVKPEKPFKKRPDQIDAVNAIEKEFKKTDRTQVIMACGTGKTVVSIWAAEKMRSSKIIVLVPTLALLRQIYKEWHKHYHKKGIKFFAVCSDFGITKKIDELEFDELDMDFPVTKGVAELKKQIKGEKNLVVFSTYDSSYIVGKANKGLSSFDYGVFDEAHKTAGRSSPRYSLSLSDKNIHIRKRLFLTATPVVVNARKKEKSGEFGLLNSMNDEAAYGKPCYTLNFSEAAKKGIICDYKIVASIITKKEVTNELLRRGEVRLKKDDVVAMQVANQLTLKQAIEKFKITKGFSFHSTIASAKSFASKSDEGITRHVKKLEAFHVNGSQPTSYREQTLSEFGHSKLSIVTNARCLTEGVDLPVVDCVAFIQPKKSPIDIVQAVGRAMRKAGPLKKFGYIFLPIFIEEKAGESLEAAITRADLTQLIDILSAMRDHDDSLRDELELVAIENGKKLRKGYVGRVFKNKLKFIGPSILPSVSLAKLSGSISLKVIDKLIVGWNVMFGLLQRWYAAKRTAIIPNNLKFEGKALGTWVTIQRGLYLKSKLKHARIEKLASLKLWVWDGWDAYWDIFIKELIKFKSKHGHANVVRSYKDKSLASWVNNVRDRNRKNLLSKDQLHKLNEIGFIFEPRLVAKEKNLTKLAKYKKKHGHCNVPRSYSDKTLQRFVGHVREKHSKGLLTESEINELNNLDFDWNPSSSNRREGISKIKDYYNKHGHLNPVKVKSKELKNILMGKRNAYAGEVLPEDEIKLLKSYGFVFDVKQNDWMIFIKHLTDYRKQHGHCNVPQKYKSNSLGNKVSRARQLYREKNPLLTNDKINELDKLGFVWNMSDHSWQKFINNLAEFKVKHGHCNVPQSYKSNALGSRVQKVRRYYKDKNSYLSNDKINQLKQFGFVWSV